MERLDHLPPDDDQRWASHLSDNQEEDYLFLTTRGRCTHEQALQRIGISQATYLKRKERYGWGSRSISPRRSA